MGVRSKFYGDGAYARSTDPDTSHAAARSIDAPELEKKIYAVILQYGRQGCIADQVFDQVTSHKPFSISPRFRPLMRKGYIWDTGERRTGEAGRQQRVMAATKFFSPEEMSRSITRDRRRRMKCTCKKVREFYEGNDVDGYWADHPKIEEWREEVANNDTRQGFWEWLCAAEGIIEI